MNEPALPRFWSLHANGRARVALAVAVFLPPIALAWEVPWREGDIEWMIVAREIDACVVECRARLVGEHA